MTTVKEIHSAFNAEVAQTITGSQYESLKIAGFNIAPPKELSAAFPLNKLIHKNKILHLCKKYNLRFAYTSDYIGIIPRKNIEELDNFIKANNYVHVRQRVTCFRIGNKSDNDHLFVKDSEKHLYKNAEYWPVFDWGIVAPKQMIAAPSEEQKKVKIRTAQDPIIIAMIRPKFWAKYQHGGVEWGVIVTAWGDEASDEDVVNEKMN